MRNPVALIIAVSAAWFAVGAAAGSAATVLVEAERFADRAKKSPGTAEECGDATKEAVVRAEPKIDLFLNTRAFAVAREEKRITGVSCLDTRTSRESVFTGRFFCDATGHATIGHLAGAETVMEPKGRMGMSNVWTWAEEARRASPDVAIEIPADAASQSAAEASPAPASAAPSR